MDDENDDDVAKIPTKKPKKHLHFGSLADAAKVEKIKV
jgi:hypothetical protein